MLVHHDGCETVVGQQSRITGCPYQELPATSQLAATYLALQRAPCKHPPPKCVYACMCIFVYVHLCEGTGWTTVRGFWIPNYDPTQSQSLAAMAISARSRGGAVGTGAAVGSGLAAIGIRPRAGRPAGAPKPPPVTQADGPPPKVRCDCDLTMFV